MCGIVGVFSVRGAYRCSAKELVSMRDTMTARGPDDAGLLVRDHEGVFAGLAHRRLSIIDLSPLGRQPMQTADGRLTIVFNGEIFNYPELRRELVDRGKYHFRSKTDTEVILYGLEEWGIDGCLKRLRGMYAFAVFDDRDKSVTLVRDPLGVKPLYYSIDSERLLFASEIKAIIAAPGFSREIDEASVYHYLTFTSSPAPMTFFRGVRKLEAGTYLRIDSEWRPRSVRYWDSANFCGVSQDLSEADCISQTLRLLRKAVERRMVSDVPFGVFLSGGVDSSLNVALMAEMMEQPVETFSIAVKNDPTDDLMYARRVSKHFGTNHHEIVIDDEDFLAFFPIIAKAQDEPLADPVCVPLYYLAKLARETGTIVVQVGEGSDELFAGYELYWTFDRWERSLYRPYLRLPQSVKTLLYVFGASMMPPQFGDALRRAVFSEPLFMGNAIAFWDLEKRDLIKKKMSVESSSEFIEKLCRPFAAFEPLDRIIALELKNRLPELLLVRVDKMTMASSVEARVPFLDEDLVEFALQIPVSYKKKGGISKYVLKKAGEAVLPKDVVYRKKWGFCGSPTNILSDGLVRYARGKILKSSFAKEWFYTEKIERLFEQHKRSKRFNACKIWNLLNLVLWYEEWFGK